MAGSRKLSPSERSSSRDGTSQSATDGPKELCNREGGLDDYSISQFRKFFELLDRWDRDEKKVV